MSETTTIQREKMIADLRVVVADAEHLLKLTAGDIGESAAGLRQRLQARLDDSKARLLALQAKAAGNARAAGRAADEYAHEHPWHAAAAGAAVGLVVGILLTRK